MQINTPNLFIEINELNYIFVAITIDDDQNIKILKKIITASDGFNKNKFININQVSELIKKNVEIIETSLNHIFKEVTIIIENFNCTCVNISGFKKLNGSQLNKDNISYILNSLKLAVTENEKQKTILHIFNSKSVLDGISIENLPIGLYGDFYNHQLTFFLIENNDYKNIRQIFNKNNLSVNKILLKNYSEGTQLINQNNSSETFYKLKINKNSSYINYFYKAAFIHEEKFNFGTSIIFKDIEKICSINLDTIENAFSNKFALNSSVSDEFLEKKYFTNVNYRKIRKKLIIDIAKARINEIANIILTKNINVQSFEKENCKIYINIQDKLIFNNFKENFKFFFSQNDNFETHLINNSEIEESIKNTVNLSIYGWKKEAIPIIQTKSSLITRIFKSLFE